MTVVRLTSGRYVDLDIINVILDECRSSTGYVDDVTCLVDAGWTPGEAEEILQHLGVA